MENKTYYKITNKEEKHYDFQFKDGLNVLEEQFNAESCDLYGFDCLYCTDIENIVCFINSGIYLREVYLPFDDPKFRIIKRCGGDVTYYRVNMMILGKRHDLKDVATFKMITENKKLSTNTEHNIIQWCLSHGYVDVLRYMMNNGAKLEFKYALEEVIRRNHYEMLKYLLTSHPTDINELMLESIDHIHFKDEKCHIETIRVFIEAGADLHYKNDTLLITYARDAMPTVVKYLVDAGADIHAENDYVLNRMVALNHIEMVKYLVELGANVTAENNQVIKTSVANNNKNMIEYLLDKGAKITDDKIIDIAIEENDFDIIKNLLDHSKIDPEVIKNIQNEIERRSAMLSIFE